MYTRANDLLARARELFEDHYWDSLQPDRGLILLHVEAVLGFLRAELPGDSAPAPQNAIPQRGEPLGRIEGEQGCELPGRNLGYPPGGRVAPSDGVSGQ